MGHDALAFQGANGGRRLDTAHLRHVNIEQSDVESFEGQNLHRFTSAGHPDHRMPPLFQHPRQTPIGRIAFGYQYTAHAAGFDSVMLAPAERAEPFERFRRQRGVNRIDQLRLGHRLLEIRANPQRAIFFRFVHFGRGRQDNYGGAACRLPCAEAFH